MILRWMPPEGPEREWTFSPLDLESHESEAIELVGGPWWETYDQFGRLFMKGSTRAHRAMVWVMLRREDPRLQFDEVSIRAGSVSCDFDPLELSAIRAGVEANPDLDVDEKTFLLAALDRGEVPEEAAPNPSPVPAETASQSAS